MRHGMLLLIAFGMLTRAATAAPPTTSPPPQPSGGGQAPSNPPSGKAPIMGNVYIGERAPDFVLDGSSGKPEKLSGTRGSWVLLVFSERYEHLSPLDSVETEARDIGGRVVGVCHEKQQRLMGSNNRPAKKMLMLADATGEVSAMYGLFDWQHGSTQPGFFVLDPDGIVRLAVGGKLFPPDQMVELLRFATTSWK